MPLITFEGCEGCGKSTQVERFCERLITRGITPLVLREPGGTAIGEIIRHLLQHSEENRVMTPETELLLFEASRSQLVREKLRPALARNEFVICDRFYDSTTVYQGAARKLPAQLVETLNQFAAADCVPNLTFVIDLDRAAAKMRMGNRRNLRDRMEEQPEDFHERVRQAYLALAASNPERITLIDGRQGVDEIEDEIWRVALTRFPKLADTLQP